MNRNEWLKEGYRMTIDDDVLLIGDCLLCRGEIRCAPPDGFSDCEFGWSLDGDNYGYVHGACKAKALRNKGLYDSERT